VIEAREAPLKRCGVLLAGFAGFIDAGLFGASVEAARRGADIADLRTGRRGPLTDILKEELAAMAAEELERACSLPWRALSKVTPWGDTHEAFSPSGRNVEIERNYLWAGAVGGDVLVEVVVFQNAALYDEGARASRLIRKP
jgi:hypothetical protein